MEICMSDHIDPILRNWAYDPETVNVRVVEGDDGREPVRGRRHPRGHRVPGAAAAGASPTELSVPLATGSTREAKPRPKPMPSLVVSLKPSRAQRVRSPPSGR